MIFKWILILWMFSLVSAHDLFANELEPRGVLVKFKRKSIAVDDFLVQQGLKIKKFYPRSNVQSYELLENPIDFKNLCKSILTFPGVEDCMVNHVITRNAQNLLEGSICADCVTGSLQDPKCKLSADEPTFQVNNGKLSDYWAQELTGADLVREILLQKYRNKLTKQIRESCKCS